VFAALVAIINTKLPQVGELVLTGIISQFRKLFKRNNKVGIIIIIMNTLLLVFFVFSSTHYFTLFYLDRPSFHNHFSHPSSQSIPRT
jgi:hypothetical protein